MIQDLSSSTDMSKSHHECTHHVNKAGILKRAECEETQSFTPFEQEEGGVIKSTTFTHIQLQKSVKNGI